ncbi:MAG: general secretion pathway protein E [Motiliproteus sp.]|jgi:general secretion pathway protein E
MHSLPTTPPGNVEPNHAESKGVSALPRLPFSFANRFKVALRWDPSGAVATLMHTASTPLCALLEVQRLIQPWQKPLQLQCLDAEAFAQLLSEGYQQSSQANMQLMEQIGDEVDLFKLVQELPENEDLLAAEDDAPIIKLINALLAEAIKEGASDIHIEPYEKRLSIRLRVDGVMREVLSPNYKLAALLISRIKVMAKLDIAEKRVPQDGRVSLKIAGRALDVRVSTLPANNGERVVMRLLDKQAAVLGMTHLGMQPETLAQFKKLLLQPNGIILVTGPTGSGKTTTLYAGLGMLNTRDRNILTAEDPIEYTLDGIGQTQVNPKAGMTFAKSLRAMLRQDPDILMVGEIRDLETAEIAVQASLTGHLVLSTLHTNNAVGAITRLQDIGVGAYLIATSVKGVLAQRLVRRLCTHCKQPHPLDEDEAAQLGDPHLTGTSAFRAAGCSACNHSGYRGRIGVYELLLIDEPLSELIHAQASETELYRYLRKQLATLQHEARALIAQGTTSVAEVSRSIRSD